MKKAIAVLALVFVVLFLLAHFAGGQVGTGPAGPIITPATPTGLVTQTGAVPSAVVIK